MHVFVIVSSSEGNIHTSVVCAHMCAPIGVVWVSAKRPTSSVVKKVYVGPYTNTLVAEA